ncbi:hypothetical protein [Georgenia sp. AZ-5]|uniref:hypothetical protein n=1 Tax=Georgenia sp. AZ-5 TaxID=3367526 RepID=UPI0037547EC6
MTSLHRNARLGARVTYAILAGIAGVVFTLLVVSVRKGERMAQALESRGRGESPAAPGAAEGD